MAIEQSDITTIQIFRDDRETLEARYGKPAYQAVRRALSACEHPEGEREYIAVTVNAVDPGAALNERDGSVSLSGYFCRACKCYILPVREQAKR